MRVTAGVLAAVLVGCSEPVGPGIDPVPPQRHSNPAWSSNDVIAFEDQGAVCVSPNGGYQIDASKAGIWLWDAKTSSRVRFLSTGHTPAWDPTGRLLAVGHDFELSVYDVAGG